MRRADNTKDGTIKMRTRGRSWVVVTVSASSPPALKSVSGSAFWKPECGNVEWH